MRFVHLALLVWLLAGEQARAQQLVCENFEVKPQPCQPFFVGNWSQVATIPSLGVSQEFLESRMLSQAAGVTLPPGRFLSPLDGMPPLPYHCAVAYARALCVSYYSPCFSNGAGGATTAPVCRSVCEDYLHACRNHDPVDFCDAVSPITGQPVFSSAPGCTDNGVAAPSDVVYPCPPGPLKFVGGEARDPLTGAACAQKCVDQLYWGMPKSRFDALFIAVSVGAWLSLVSAVALIVLFTAIPAFRRWPSRLIIYSSVGILLFMIGIAGNSTQDPESFMCDANGVELQSEQWCRFSAFALTLGGSLTATWWWIQVGVMFWHIGLQRKDKTEKLEPLFHLFVWGYNITYVLILLFVPDGDGMGASVVGPYCFRTSSSLEGMWWGLFYGPFIFYCLCAIVWLAVTVATMLRIGLRTVNRSQIGQFTGILLGFGLWYLNALISVIVTGGVGHSYRGELTDAVPDYYRCVFTTAGDPDRCADLIPPITFGVTVWTLISLSYTGFIYLLLFIVFRPSARDAIKESVTNLTSRSSSRSSRTDSSHS